MLEVFHRVKEFFLLIISADMSVESKKRVTKYDKL